MGMAQCPPKYAPGNDAITENNFFEAGPGRFLKLLFSHAVKYENKSCFWQDYKSNEGRLIFGRFR